MQKYFSDINFINLSKNNGQKFDTSPQTIAADIIAKNKKINLFIEASEALAEDSIAKAIKIIRLSKVDLSSCYYLTGSVDAEHTFNKIKDSLGFSKDLNFLISNIFVRVVRDQPIISNLEYKTTIKPKLFNCLNKNHRTHRGLIVAEIIKQNFIEKSFTSLYGFWHIPESDWLDNMIQGVEFHDKNLAEILTNHKSLFPLHVNADAETRINPIYVEEMDRFIYEDSYFSIVTETIYFQEKLDPMYGVQLPSLFVTEKTYKPISAKHPFIILSVPYFLKHLKNMGLKTFHPFINEDYDNEVDDMKRFRMIVDEINRLCNFTNDEWIVWQENVKEIVEYNFDFLYNHIKPGISDLTDVIKILEGQ